MKRLAVLLLCVLSAGWGYAQQPRPSQLQQARNDADAALRREAELSSGIAGQERANAALREQLRKSGADPGGLQKDLVDASADAAAARRKVAAQKLRFDVASDNLAEARVRALQKIDQDQPTRIAEIAFDNAIAEMDRVSQPIFEKLEQDADYQQAQALAEAAAQTGAALQSFDAVDPKVQAQADAAYDQAIAAVRALEDAAIDADPRGADTHKALKRAQTNLADLRAANEVRILADPKVDAAKFALDLEQRLLDESSADLTAAEKRLTALRKGADPQGGATELAGQLKEGEARLHEMSDQLEKARVARRDAEDRLRYMEDLAAANPDGATDPPIIRLPHVDAYPPVYGGYEVPSATYIYPSYGYYDPFYCSPYYSSWLSFGAVYYSPHCYSYSHCNYNRYCNTSYYHGHHNSDWCNQYDHWRGGHGSSSTFADVRRGSGSGVVSGRVSYASGSRDYAPLGRADLTRDSRLMTDYARYASAVRDEGGTRISTYSYPGSSSWRAREADSSFSSRSRQSDTSSDRGVVSITRTRSDGSRGATEERSIQNDSGARGGSFSDSPRASRSDRSSAGEVTIRSRDADAGRSRGESSVRSSGGDGGKSVAADSGRSRGGDSTARSSGGDSGKSSSAGDSGRSRGGDAAARSSSSSSGGDAGRSSGGDSGRSRGAAGAAGSSIGSSRSGGGSGGGGSPSYSGAPSRGPSAAPSGGVSRGSAAPSGGSRGGGSPAPSSGGGRGGRR